MKPEAAPSCRELRATPGGLGSIPELCAGCGSGIQDRFLLRVDDLSWHERCLRCSACARPLSGSCFCRGRRLYCRPDYDRLFPRRCSRCRGALGRSERVQRVLQLLFHQRCLRCARCGRRLRRGDLIVLQGGSVQCRGHWQRLQRDPIDPEKGDPEGDPEGVGPNPKRPKRPRTILSSQQRRAFRASFEVSPKPCRKVRETLAAETGLTVRVVQVWFQNQRAKMKKIARRQQQQEQLGNSRGGIPGIPGGGGSGKSGRDENEEEEGLQRLPAPFSLEPKGFGNELGMFQQGMAPPGLHPYDSQGVFQVLIPPENSQQLLPRIPEIPEPGNPRIPGFPEPGNPIDHLYSMQSSYFTS